MTTYPHSLANAATRYSVPLDDVETLARNLPDDPSLYDVDTARLSDEGLNLIGHQLTAWHNAVPAVPWGEPETVPSETVPSEAVPSEPAPMTADQYRTFAEAAAASADSPSQYQRAQAYATLYLGTQLARIADALEQSAPATGNTPTDR